MKSIRRRQNFGPARLANGILVTPLARRLAAGASLQLSHVKGSGPRGRIVGRDVEQALAARAQPPLVRSEETGGPLADLYRRRPHKVVAIDGMRRTVAARLTQAKATIPHFYLTTHIEVGRLAHVRGEINDSAPKLADGAAALPALDQRLSDQGAGARSAGRARRKCHLGRAMRILQFERSDVAVAVAVPGGLFTPVIAAAETKSVSAISTEMKSLAERARQRALRPEEYQGGSTTISNLGMHGIEEFSAIINPPQATILAVGAAHRHPIEIEGGGVAFIDRMTATLSCDHRVVDGVARR